MRTSSIIKHSKPHLLNSLRALATCLSLATASMLSISSMQAQIYPLSENSWDNPDFVKRFMGSYGVAMEKEPEISREESELFQELMPMVQTNMRGAIQQLEAAISTDSSAALDYTLGNLYFQTNNLPQAIRHYETAIRKFPGFQRAYENLGRALVMRGNYDRAIDFLSKGVELGGATGDVYGLLGYCYLNEGNYQSALDAYRIALVLRPTSKDWKVGKAQALMMTENYQQATALLREMIIDQPNNDRFWFTRANAYLGLNETDQAAAHLEVLRRMGKAKATSLALLGDIYINKDLPELAYEVYSDAIDKSSGLSSTRAIRISEILTMRAAWKEAEAYIAKVENNFNDLTDAQTFKLLNIKAKVALGQGKQDEAAKILTDIIDRDPLNGGALMQLANYYWDAENIEEAEYYFERAAKIRDVEADALLDHARMMVATRDYGKAVKLLERAQLIKPRSNVADYLEAVREAHRISQAIN